LRNPIRDPAQLVTVVQRIELVESVEEQDDAPLRPGFLQELRPLLEQFLTDLPSGLRLRD